MPFAPTKPPVVDKDDQSSVEDFIRWVEQELHRLATDLNETQVVELRPIGAEPTRRRDGMIVFANGTTWNPGAGAGSYEYRAGVWVKL